MIHGLGILKRIYVKSRCILLKSFWLQIFLHTSFTNAIVDVIKFSGSDFRILKKQNKKNIAKDTIVENNCWTATTGYQLFNSKFRSINSNLLPNFDNSVASRH